ncbi:MAG: amidohydrolase [Gemmatimonadetes bacterium]|nr:amidohydrolase [Gemmatimonadota bacterium]
MSLPTNAGDLRVTLVQPDTVWREPAVNRERIAASLRCAAPTDLIVLPETFTTGFSHEAAVTAESMSGESVAWMREFARASDAAVVGSVQIRDGGDVFNRLIFATPDGALRHYDKRHLFRMAREQDWFASGQARLVVEFRDWRICPLVCYDLRFPVFARNRTEASGDGSLDYDLLLFVANWPAARHDAWRTLLRARAMENLCYVVGVNRTGRDANGHLYRGGSLATDAVGGSVVECDETPQVARTVLSGTWLAEHRRRFPAHLDADAFALEPLA